MLADLIHRNSPDAENQIRQARTLSNLTGLMPMSLALGDIEELKLNILTSKMGIAAAVARRSRSS